MVFDAPYYILYYKFCFFQYLNYDFITVFLKSTIFTGLIGVSDIHTIFLDKLCIT